MVVIKSDTLSFSILFIAIEKSNISSTTPDSNTFPCESTFIIDTPSL